MAKMSDWVSKWWRGIVGLLLLSIYIYGYQKMFFHQDDLDWLILVNRPMWGVMTAPIADHVNYVFRVLFKLEWNIFGLYFPGYLAVSLAMHAIVVWLLYLLAKVTTGRRDLAGAVAILFAVNTNWTETVWWISGQTILITALLVLVAMYGLWKKRGEPIALFFASWTSALALGLLSSTFLIYKNKRWLVGLLLIIIGAIYYFLGTDGTKIDFGWRWALQVIEVAGLMSINSVVGRLLIPFDRFETIRMGVVSIAIVYVIWRWRGRLLEIWRDEWSRFLILQLGFYNLIVAIGRAQYGVGIMRAERYTYLGLALLLLLFVRVIRDLAVGKWIWIVPVLVILQLGGFYIRARAYIERPQQMKVLFAEIRKTAPSKIDPNAYLPHFVTNDERFRYSDLLGLMNH